MDNEPDTPLEEAARLREGPDAPAALESRVVGALRTQGLIRPRTSWSSGARIAASLAIFAAGVLAGRFVSLPSSTPPSPIARYLLLLAGDVTPAADGSSRAAEYGEWARNLAAKGVAISGEELSSHAQLVATKSTAFPDLASVGGYFLIEAKNDQEAEALARTCPHVRHGGSIVIRRVQ